MGVLAAAVVAAAFVPLVGAQATTGHGRDHGGDRAKLLFFASDGLR
jgi:hypothetical protein